MVRGSAAVVLVRRELPDAEEPMVPVSGKIPGSHKARLLQISKESGYTTSDLLRLAVSHFLSTVSIQKEGSSHA